MGEILLIIYCQFKINYILRSFSVLMSPNHSVAEMLLLTFSCNLIVIYMPVV